MGYSMLNILKNWFNFIIYEKLHNFENIGVKKTKNI